MDQKQKNESVIVTLLILVILVVGYLWFKSQAYPNYVPNINKAIDSQKNSEVGVSVTKAELNDSGLALDLPAGFPSNIPVELKNITESYMAVYANRGVTQYTVTYMSDKTQNTKWQEYYGFMTKDGFTIRKDSTNKAQGTVYGDKDGSALSVLVVSKSGKSEVHLSVLLKK